MWGLAYLREQARKRRQATTKAERAALKREERSRPEYKAMAQRKQVSRAYHRADLAKIAAWERLTLAANEQDLRGVVAGTRAVSRADRAMQKALRVLQRDSSAAPLTTGARAIILPEKEDA